MILRRPDLTSSVSGPKAFSTKEPKSEFRGRYSDGESQEMEPDIRDDRDILSGVSPLCPLHIPELPAQREAQKEHCPLVREGLGKTVLVTQGSGSNPALQTFYQ